jgi:hypothetical protein
MPCLEVGFANNGAVAISVGFSPDESDRGLRASTEGDNATLHRLRIGLMK